MTPTGRSVKNYFVELFSLASRFLNVLTGDIADMTFSARSHRDGLWTEKVIDFFLGEGHCKTWYLFDVQRSKEVYDRHKNTYR